VKIEVAFGALSRQSANLPLIRPSQGILSLSLAIKKDE